MPQPSRMTRHHSFGRVLPLAAVLALAVPLLRPPPAAAQGEAQTGTVSGRVVDDQGIAVGSAQIYLARPPLRTQTRTGGDYVLARVPAGTHTLHVRMLGFRPDSASVSVAAGQETTQDFTLRRDPLQLQALIVTGTQTPRLNLDASVAVTTLTATEIDAAAPRSTTEVLRYVPGFTRVESSGGEVNQNISIRGILGVEFVAFLEDGLPVFPAFHTFFMNADNLFRFDTNIERLEVVRGGSSPLFGSSTPGAIVNFINKSGGDVFAGTMRATGATKGLARYDLNLNGPFGEDWRYNLGGFYRYDRGVRDPGFPGIQGGQLKGSVTRLLDKGYVRFSVKHIDDKNQFILPLPFTNPEDPDFVPGFSDFGSFTTQEALDLQVPTPDGELRLPLGNGLKTLATWFTADVSFELSERWSLRNTAGVMQNDQEWNALLPFEVQTPEDFIASLPASQRPPGSTAQFFFTNHFDALGNPLPFDTPNGLVAPGGLWHVRKPISAVQDQLSVRRGFGPHSLTLGAYFAYYTQENEWFIGPTILTDVRDNPRFLDVVVTPPGGTPINVTQNGFRNFNSSYSNGTGQATIISGVVGGEVQLTDRLRADLGVRVEFTDYVQNSENTAQFDLDGDPATTFDNMTFGNNTFRHFNRGITDWAASVGLNYRINDRVSVYGQGSRGYRQPVLDEFLNARAQEEVDLFDSREVLAGEGGVKYAVRGLGVTVNGFYTELKNIIGQGAEVDPVTGGTRFVTRPSPDNRSYGAEVEVFASPVPGLQLLGSATILDAELGPGVDSLVGRRLALVPTTLGNLSAIFSPQRLPGLEFKGDLHWVGSRFSESPVTRIVETKLPSYTYFNLGAAYAFPEVGVRINADLLNAFQSKGLEEGNPRLVAVGGSPIFLARPLLPRRFQVGIEYTFGSEGRQQP